jgi:DNA-binding response OmpR family regulator
MSPRPRTILLVDDEASQREILGGILRHAGFRVLSGSDYSQGVALCQRHPGEIALILVDVALPGQNGLELARALRSIEPDLKVVFMSGPAGANLCQYYGISLSSLDLLTKPVADTELLQRIRQVLQDG